MADNKTINTRILLKYDTYQNWTTNNPVLKAGEMAIATIASGNTQEVNSVTAPQVLIKVGDGTSNYNALPFVSGKAADVYGWAKAETPSFTSANISDLGTFISNYVDEELGISVDTDTQYQIVKVDDYNYKLQSKGKGDTGWQDVADSAIVIPDNTGAIEALQGLVGSTAVETRIENAIDELKLADTYEAKGAADEALNDAKSYTDTEVGKASNAASGALAEAQAKVASVTAADVSVAIGGTTTAPTVAAKLSQDADNALTLAADGLKVVVPAAAEYSIAKAENSGDYAAVYNLTKNGEIVGASINIPKDMVVESGAVVENPTGQAAGTYIKLVLQNVAEPLYINVGSLIEYVTSGSQTGDMVVVNVSDDHKVTAVITDGTITLAKLHTDIRTAIGKAHTHENADVLAGINADKVNAWDAAEQNAKDYADDLDSEMNTRVTALEAIDHEHANMDELNKIAAGDKAKWDAKQDALSIDGTVSDTNKVATQSTVKTAIEALDSSIAATAGSVLTGVTIADGKLTGKTEVALATIATTGNVNDLVQDENDYVIFDCGSSSKFI